MRTLSTHVQHTSRTRYLIVAMLAILAQAAFAVVLRYEEFRESQPLPAHLVPSAGSTSCAPGESCVPFEVSPRGRWSIA